jgi:hypothetical protein
VNERVAEVRRLVNEHLTAAMIMVPLDRPLDPEMAIADALAYLDERSFDLALLDTNTVRIVYRERLAQIPEGARTEPIKKRADSPRADRLIEHGLELREVARRLRQDRIPLLVVGRTGPEHIVSLADFGRTAGQAAVLAVLAVLDAQLDELLRRFDAEAWPHLSDERQAEIVAWVDAATAR